VLLLVQRGVFTIDNLRLFVSVEGTYQVHFDEGAFRDVSGTIFGSERSSLTIAAADTICSLWCGAARCTGDSLNPNLDQVDTEGILLGNGSQP
jgi:hypothetical protein